jgi:methylmalonyl-CoA/ethylmalonyl-CoA epimerase
MTTHAAASSAPALGQVSLTVKDVARATDFFRNVLRLPFLFDVPGQMAFFDGGGVRVLLGASEKPEVVPGASSVLYFRVPDIDATFRDITARGAKAVRPPHFLAKMPDHDLWMAFFEDTEGNTLALMEERREKRG